MLNIHSEYDASVLLEDGKIFFCNFCGTQGVANGEICFTTSMTGYQHTITDPSYAGQIITFSFPHIGNIGINELDNESHKIHARALVMRERPISSYHYQSRFDFIDWMNKKNIIGVYGVDTRSLIRHIRKYGAQNACIFPSNMEPTSVRKLIENCEDISSFDIFDSVVPNQISRIKSSTEKSKGKIVVVDFGVKKSILDAFSDFEVIIVPGIKGFSAKIIEINPCGVIFSNGPGDPKMSVSCIKDDMLQIIKNPKFPILAICLGHQLSALSLGFKTSKMKVGHRGSNHPVYSVRDDIFVISSQNHGFVVDEDSLSDEFIVTHRSLFDETIEGFEFPNGQLYSFQHHPEASPGTNDCGYIFENFKNVIRDSKS